MHRQAVILIRGVCRRRLDPNLVVRLRVTEALLHLRFDVVTTRQIHPSALYRKHLGSKIRRIGLRWFLDAFQEFLIVKRSSHAFTRADGIDHIHRDIGPAQRIGIRNYLLKDPLLLLICQLQGRS